MVLPTELSSPPDAHDETASDAKAAVGGDELLLATQGRGDGSAGAGGEEGDGDGIADELIRVSLFSSRLLSRYGL